MSFFFEHIYRVAFRIVLFELPGRALFQILDER